MAPPAQVANKSSEPSAISVPSEALLNHATAETAAKRSSSSRFQPILKGVLSHDENGVVTWKGSWGMSEEDFTDEKRSEMLEPFLYQREKVLEKGSNKTLLSENQFEGNSDSSALKLAKDGCFSGYFYIKRQPSNSSPRGSKTVRSSEKNLILRFSKLIPSGEVTSSASECYKVSGSGKNRFGKFMLEGNFDAKTGRMDLIRNYLPRSSRPMNLSRVKRELKDLDVGFNHQDTIISTIESSASRVRKGKRVRKISAKVKEIMKNDTSVKVGISIKQDKKIEGTSVLLQKLMHKDMEKWFCSPVNAQKLGLKDYHEIITSPMDLGTVKLKLDQGAYQNAAAVKADIELTFQNALLYNTIGQPVHARAKELLEYFQQEFEKVQNGDLNEVNGEKVNCKRKALETETGLSLNPQKCQKVSGVAGNQGDNSIQVDPITSKTLSMSQNSCNSLKSASNWFGNIDPLTEGLDGDLEEESILHLKNELISIGFL